MVLIKRIYDQPTKSDGFRILVDRLWPRGVSKERAAIDLWLKDIAPTPALRTWFNHSPERFAEFSRRYSEEIAQNASLSQLRAAIASHKQVTLLYAAKNLQINHALVLQNYLKQHK